MIFECFISVIDFLRFLVFFEVLMIFGRMSNRSGRQLHGTSFRSRFKMSKDQLKIKKNRSFKGQSRKQSFSKYTSEITKFLKI